MLNKEKSSHRGELDENLALALLNALPCAVTLTDLDGHIIWVNRGFSDICGYSSKEALGERPGSLLQGPGTDQQTVQRISKAVFERAACSERILNYDKRGRAYWVTLDIAPFQNGENKGFVAVTRDLTQSLNRAGSSEIRTPQVGHLAEAVGHLAQAANEELELHQFCLSLADALASLKGR